MKLSLSIIAKDQVKDVERILNAYEQYFDSVDVAVDASLAEFQALQVNHHKLRVYDYSKEPRLKGGRIDFAHKRNWLAEQIDADYYFRLDTDDAIVGVENVKAVVEKADREDVTLIYCWYDYAKDKDGNVNAGHNREAIVRKDGVLFWNKPIHENLIPKGNKQYKYVVDKSFKIDHLVEEGHAEKSLERNIQYFIEEYNQDRENTDPRTIAYLGRTFADLGDWDKAIFFLQKHIDNSGWDEDRYMSWVRLGDVLLRTGKLKEAISACMEAIVEREDYPDAYLKLHDIYFEMGQWKKAINWGQVGMSKKSPETFMLLDPASYTWRPAISMAHCYLELGEYEKAKELFDYAKSLAPNFQYIKDNENLYQEAFLIKKFLDKFLWVYGYTKENDGSNDKILKLFESLPKSMEKHELLVRIKNEHIKPKNWSDKSIVIYCPKVFEQWADPSVIQGIGGSEEAVIYLSRELVKLGFEVTVFNDCGELEGMYNGVRYCNYHEFNIRDKFNILVSWRSNIFNQGAKANKRIIWLHDVPYSQWFRTPEEMETFDKIVVLSEFHKSLLPPEVPQEKIFVSSNGINLEDFKDSDIERDPYRLIYASSYNRGLEQLLTIWKDVREAVPQANLHIYYGWNNFDKLAKEGGCDPTFKETIERLMAQPGVIHHGRIGHKKLIQEFQKASIWAYPCTFPEIHCITALKAQACNAIPVITTYSAISETTKCGFFVPGNPNDPGVVDLYKEELIRVLKDQEVQEVARQALVEMDKTSFGWDAIASDWAMELFSKEPALV